MYNLQIHLLLFFFILFFLKVPHESLEMIINFMSSFLFLYIPVIQTFIFIWVHSIERMLCLL